MSDTLPYLILGLAAVATILILFLGSLFVRYRNLQRDAELIEQLTQDQ